MKSWVGMVWVGMVGIWVVRIGVEGMGVEGMVVLVRVGMVVVIWRVEVGVGVRVGMSCGVGWVSV
jgi:hypothetical protein